MPLCESGRTRPTAPNTCAAAAHDRGRDAHHNIHFGHHHGRHGRRETETNSVTLLGVGRRLVSPSHATRTWGTTPHRCCTRGVCAQRRDTREGLRERRAADMDRSKGVPWVGHVTLALALERNRLRELLSPLATRCDHAASDSAAAPQL